MMDHAQYMRKAITYAAGTNTNILGRWVGVVIVNDGGDIVAYGRREFTDVLFGGTDHGSEVLHAERVGILNAQTSGTDRVRGATLYSTIEPCFREEDPDDGQDGLLGHCSGLIVESGIRRVITASIDPNPNISGAGVDFLRSHDVDVLILPNMEEMAMSLYNSHKPLRLCRFQNGNKHPRDEWDNLRQGRHFGWGERETRRHKQDRQEWADIGRELRGY